MICPNCGRSVRSKNQCAHCGHVFTSEELKAMKNGSILPKHKNESNLKDYDYENDISSNLSEDSGHESVDYQPAHNQDNINRPSEEDYHRAEALEDKQAGHIEETGQLGQTHHESVNQSVDDDPYQMDEEEMRRIHEAKQAESMREQQTSMDEDDLDDDPAEGYRSQPRRRGGFLSILWGILKLLLAVVIVFLLFLYGPRLIRQAKDVLNGNGGSDNSVETSQSSDQSLESTSETEGQTGSAVTNESGAGSSSYTLTGSQVEVPNGQYPLVEAELDFEDDLTSIDRDTFAFSVKSGDETYDLGDAYALSKEGKQLKLSFNDPSAGQRNSQGQASLLVTSQDGDFEEEIAFDKPNQSVDAQIEDKVNQVLSDNLANEDAISAYLKEAGSDQSPYLKNPNSLEAGNQLSWFILQAVYEAVEAQELALEDPVMIQDDLLAPGDTGSLATEGQSEQTVGSLLTAMVESNDVTAMNHLIQSLGGPNKFNAWLNDHHYFATKVNNLLAVDDTSGAVTGAATDVQDLGRLLEQLAQDQLVSSSSDSAIKDLLVKSPMTNKYPASGIESVSRRFEVASNDDNQNQQYYAGILETETANYVVIFMDNQVDDPAAAVQAIGQSVDQVASLLMTGDLPEDSEESASSEESSDDQTASTPDDSQVSIVSEAPTETSPAQAAQTPQGNPNGREDYYSQKVENTGEYVQLPNRSYVNENGQVVEPKWYWDEASKTYKYQ